MKIPIILLNYNSSKDCRKCISFLKRQTVETEIVVVDNNSPREGEKSIIERLCREQKCTFLQAKDNRGYNAGNNIGLRYACKKGYEYALIANPDMEFPQENYVERLLKVMIANKEIAICGSDIINNEGKHQNPQREPSYWEELLWPFTYIKNRHKDDWYLCDYKHSGFCSKLIGCCIMVRLSFISHIGYFDERVFLYSEEAILSKQVIKEQKAMFYVSDTFAIHRHIKSEKGNRNKNMSIFYKSREYYLSEYCRYNKHLLKLLQLSKLIQRKICKIF